MILLDHDWKGVEIADGAAKQAINIRLRRIAGSGAEKIAVADLSAAFPAAQPLRIRMEPLSPGEHVASLGYPVPSDPRFDSLGKPQHRCRPHLSPGGTPRS